MHELLGTIIGLTIGVVVAFTLINFVFEPLSDWFTRTVYRIQRMSEPTKPFTVWEGERGGIAQGKSYRTRTRAIVSAWWVSLYNGHDVWIEHDMPRVSFAPQTGPHGPAGDSGTARR